MDLTVNGDSRTVPHGCTVQGLVELLRLPKGPVAVEVNRQVIRRAEHASVELSEGDVVEIVHFVGGG